MHKNTSSRYPGLSWDKRNKKWRARYVLRGKEHFLGRFTDEQQAFAAYCSAVESIGESVISRG
jgi:hypothetical protein